MNQFSPALNGFSCIMPPAPMAILHDEQHAAFLEKLAQNNPDMALRQRARLLLLYEAGRPTAEVAQTVGLAPSTARRWKRRYLHEGLTIFPGLVSEEVAADGDEVPPPRTLDDRIDDLFEAVQERIGGKKKLKKYRSLSRKKRLKKLGGFLKKRRTRVRTRLKEKDLKRKKRKRLKQLRADLKLYLRETRMLLKELDD